jgi:hypothetical protein
VTRKRNRGPSDGALRPSAPGWYPDPFSADGSGQRYFDGVGWSTENRPLGPRESRDDGEEPRSHRSSRIIAIVLVVALVGGTAIGLVRVVLSSDSSASTSPPAPVAPTTPTTSLVRNYAAGECVTWMYTNGGDSWTDEAVVPCSEMHMAEIVGKVALDHLPGKSELERLYTGACTRFADARLGHPIDSIHFSASGLVPDEAAWERGDHTLWCAVEQLRGPGRATVFVGGYS